MGGFIKLDRKFFDNFLWSEARIFSKAEAWIDLIQLARFEASTELINGKAIELQRGEIPISRRYLELRWNWGSTKVSNFLHTLATLGMTNQRQCEGQTILLLVKYGLFNDKQTNGKPQTKPTANQRQTIDKPSTNQYKEYKEGKEFKERKEVCEEENFSNFQAHTPDFDFFKNLIGLEWQRFDLQFYYNEYINYCNMKKISHSSSDDFILAVRRWINTDVKGNKAKLLNIVGGNGSNMDRIVEQALKIHKEKQLIDEKN
jgi:hypothetical protein